MRRVLSFFGRRLTPGEYLGLHLTLGLLISLAGLAAFVLIARAVGEERGLPEFDAEVAAAMQRHADTHPGLLRFFRLVTHLGGIPFLTALAVFGGLLLMVRRRRFLALVWFVAALGGGLLDLELKEGFERKRPS